MINQQIPVEHSSSSTNGAAAAPEAAPAEKDHVTVIELIERIASVVLPIGVALYAMLYIGVEQIYNVFGISPQQAGIDQAVLFGRLSSALVLLLLVVLPALGVIVGLGWLANKVTLGLLARLVRAIRERPWVIAVIAALWCGATYWGFFNLFADLDLAVMVTIAVGLGVVAFLVPFRLMRRKPVGRAGMKLLVGAMTGLGLGFLLILQMTTAAVDAYTTGKTSLLLDAVGFQNQWAVVKNGDDKPLYDGRRMMLLGEADGGIYVFYDCDKMITIRRAADHTNLGELEIDPDQPKGFACGSKAEEQAAQ
ncbi:hypothetical protein OG589_43975 [Sphaerisporangium sp. NBC_01403]|uniref:hypothetical protein n=1 Tax=Sphaerisporangium sp. NBC_01403 TaxID=2903599 RepID=UPI0032452A53